MDVESESDSDDEALELIANGALLGAQPVIGEKVGEWFLERAKYIPVSSPHLPITLTGTHPLIQVRLNAHERYDSVCHV